jgi:DNA repair exonuclease SbcCD ATPase subunit
MKLAKFEESFNEEKRRCSDQLQEREKEYQKFQGQLKFKFEKERASLNKQVQEKEKDILDCSLRVQELEKEIQKWKNTARALKNGKKDKEQQALNALKMLEETENTYKEKLQRERQALKSQCEKLNQQLKDKNAELFNLHQKVVDELQRSEERLRFANQEDSKLEEMKLQMENRMPSLNEDLEREKKLLDSKIKTLTLSTEMRCHSAIEDLKTEFGVEKRRIYGFFANAFRQFFDSTKQLGEESFKDLVSQVKLEMDRLIRQENSIQRLLKITQYESVEDSVAKLLLSLYRPSKHYLIFVQCQNM